MPFIKFQVEYLRDGRPATKEVFINADTIMVAEFDNATGQLKVTTRVNGREIVHDLKGEQAITVTEMLQKLA